MTDLDLLVVEALEHEVPYRRDAEPDWRDVMARAGVQAATNAYEPNGASVSAGGARRRARRRRRAVLLGTFVAAVVVALATPLGAAVARTIGDFSTWLTGAPGTPASDSEDRAFEDENARAWTAFPDQPELRKLIERRLGDVDYVLFGYRTGGSLCLRLTSSPPVPLGGPGYWRPSTACAPLRELRAAGAPAIVLRADDPRGYTQMPAARGRTREAAEVYATFGIAADAVETIQLISNRGKHETDVSSNAFLFLAHRPPRAFRIKSVAAVDSAGASSDIPFAASPFDEKGAAPASNGRATGPSIVEHRVTGGAIGWLERREERGQSIAEANIDPRVGSMGGRHEPLFARVIAPDPKSLLRVLLMVVRYDPAVRGLPGPKVQMICTQLISRNDGGGGGCSSADEYFAHGPLGIGMSSEHGGSQHVVFAGAASDDVARIDLHLATRERVAVPLQDNALAVEVARTSFPARFVAYDRQGQIIGIETFRDDLFVDRGPRPVPGKQRVILRVTGAAGTRATLREGPSTDGGRCSRYSFSPDGTSGGGCPPKNSKAPPPVALGVQPTAKDLFVTGIVSDLVRAVELRFEDGETITIKPVAGYVLWPVPSERLAEGHRLVAAAGRDAAGAVVGQYMFRIPPALYEQLDP